MSDDRPATSTVAVLLGTAERPSLIRWTTWWDSPGSWDSYALVTADGPMLVDPEALTAEGEARLLELLGTTPRVTLLTNDMHERGAYVYREKWGAPVYAPAYGTLYDGTPDHRYQQGDALPGGLIAHRLEGGAFPGDTVLKWMSPEGKRVLFTGDALNGGFNRLNPAGPHPRRGEPGLYLGAGPFYLEKCSAGPLKESMRGLLEERIDVIAGAHGDPVTGEPHDMLGSLLEVEWEPLLKEKQFPVARG
jgi:glyoxylase-like metal-dependent hydrolase (beta-lactamase superfamily II)